MIRLIFLVICLIGCGDDNETNTQQLYFATSTPYPLPERNCPEKEPCANCNTLEGVRCLGFVPEAIHDCFGSKECERGRFELVREICFYDLGCF
jgi:hypothetical protein